VSRAPSPSDATTTAAAKEPPAASRRPFDVHGPRENPGGIDLRFLPIDLLLRPLPALTASALRCRILRAAGLRLAKSSIFWGMPTFLGTGDVAGQLTIGEVCGINVGCVFELEDRITLHDHVSVGHNVMFLTRTYEMGPGAQRAGAVVRAPIVIEEGAWLGARCTIMPGVTVGAGAVIGASVVVTQNVPANTLLTGSNKISLAKWR
jgi:maltose O-acetyltransferase